jgi:hypothetical protein
MAVTAPFCRQSTAAGSFSASEYMKLPSPWRPPLRERWCRTLDPAYVRRNSSVVMSANLLSASLKGLSFMLASWMYRTFSLNTLKRRASISAPSPLGDTV